MESSKPFGTGLMVCASCKDKDKKKKEQHHQEGPVYRLEILAALTGVFSSHSQNKYLGCRVRTA